MIKLHTFPSRYGLESASPFAMKAEVYLKLAKLPYVTVRADPRTGPKGKVPWIDDDGRLVADSSAIVAYLEKKHGEPLDGGLDARDAAKGHVVKRTFEESFYFVLMWSRWVEDAGWEEMKKFFDFIPSAVRWAVAPMIRKKVVEALHAQGTGRHTRDEIYALGVQDIDAIAAVLGEKPFMLGDRLRTIDCTAYAFLANVLRVPLESPLTAAARKHANLEAYVTRMSERVAAAQTTAPT